MNNLINYSVSFLTGAILSVMVYCNSALSSGSSTLVSIICNQVVGVIILSLTLVLGKRSAVICPPKKKAPVFLYFSGLYGLMIMAINCFTLPKVGVGLSMASAVLGQSLFSLVFDTIGFMGLQKRPIRLPKALGLVVSLGGIVVMGLSSKTFPIGYILLGILAGMMTTTQMVCNSHFAKLKGPFFSARQNALTGLIGISIFSAVFYGSDTVKALSNLTSIPWFIIIGGGVIAIIVVISTCIIIPKIPVVYSSLLMSSAQLMMSVLLDKLLTDKFSSQLLIGSLIVLAGIVGSILTDRDR